MLLLHGQWTLEDEEEEKLSIYYSVLAVGIENRSSRRFWIWILTLDDDGWLVGSGNLPDGDFRAMDTRTSSSSRRAEPWADDSFANAWSVYEVNKLECALVTWFIMKYAESGERCWGFSVTGMVEEANIRRRWSETNNMSTEWKLVHLNGYFTVPNTILG